MDTDKPASDTQHADETTTAENDWTPEWEPDELPALPGGDMDYAYKVAGKQGAGREAVDKLPAVDRAALVKAGRNGRPDTCQAILHGEKYTDMDLEARQ